MTKSKDMPCKIISISGYCCVLKLVSLREVMENDCMDSYRKRLDDALDCLDEGAIDALVEHLKSARASGSRIWIMGNGGSATTADHLATDLMRCSDTEGNAVKAISLCSNVGVITATANDLGYDETFTRQLSMHSTPGDSLITISASGNSPNILGAIEWAKANSITTIGFTGFDGGHARALVDFSIHVNSALKDYGVVEDAHLVVCHMVSEALRDEQERF